MLDPIIRKESLSAMNTAVYKPCFVIVNFQKETSTSPSVKNRFKTTENKSNTTPNGSYSYCYEDRFNFEDLEGRRIYLNCEIDENIMDSAQNIGRRIIFGVTYGDSTMPPHSAEM